MKLKNLKIKLIMFFSSFLAVFSFLPCRGIGCLSCSACFSIPLLALGFAYAGRIKNFLRRFSLGKP